MHCAKHESSTESDILSDVTERKSYAQSMYVELFQEMMCVVLENERHLFTARELACLTNFFEIPYNAQYLFVRLLQRKKGQWYRIDKLEYASDIGDVASAARTLSTPLSTPSMSTQAACLSDTLDQTVPEKELNRFAIMDQDMEGGIRSRLDLLTVNELKSLAKRLGKKRVGNRSDIIANLLAKPTNAVLCSASASRTLSICTKPTYERLESELNAMMHGGCICLHPVVFELMERLAFVYYRGKPVLGTMLTSAVLARAHKFVFPSYIYARQSQLFPTRSDLLLYEQAIQWAEYADMLVDQMRTQVDAAKTCVTLLDTCEPAWMAALRQIQNKYPNGIQREHYPLLRFHQGWALTRVLFKACECLARLGHHQREMDICKRLLTQRFFWRDRRGAWHERLILLTGRHKSKAEALALCHKALLDPDTHLLYMFRLQRRVVRLESQLKIPLKNRHLFARSHCEPNVVCFEGLRVNGHIVRPKGALRQTVLCKNGTIPAPLPARVSTFASPDDKTGACKVGQRTRWQGANGANCTVEQFCLEQYAMQGFRGYHSEGGIIKFLFVLLMWDVLFLPIPGAFETPYQRAPMDLGTDVFVIARQNAIEKQLQCIRDTGGLDIIQRVDSRERPQKTYAMGCRWDEFSLPTLLEIAECLGGARLSTLCQVLCNNGANTSGFPDLTLWRYEDKQIRMAEVKSPKDRLNESQRVWIDALLSAGICVDLAKVQIIEHDPRDKEAACVPDKPE